MTELSPGDWAGYRKGQNWSPGASSLTLCDLGNSGGHLCGLRYQRKLSAGDRIIAVPVPLFHVFARTIPSTWKALFISSWKSPLLPLRISKSEVRPCPPDLSLSPALSLLVPTSHSGFANSVNFHPEHLTGAVGLTQDFQAGGKTRSSQSDN